MDVFASGFEERKEGKTREQTKETCMRRININSQLFFLDLTVITTFKQSILPLSKVYAT